MNKIFESIKLGRPKMSAFDLSHDRKMSLDMGKLYPCFHEEVLPSDQFSVKSDLMIKFAPMIAPVMHNMDAYVHFFFVPNRIIWNQWEEFITGGKEGTSVVALPKVDCYSATTDYGTLADYFGIPKLTPASAVKINALPFRAYTEIYNEYYRDQNLSDPIDYTQASWGTGTGWSTIYNRAWEKDYFTSALPWAQRGPEVTAPVELDNAYKSVSEVLLSTGVAPQATAGDNLRSDSSGNLEVETSGGWAQARIENLEGTNGIDVDIRELRRTARLQEFFEKAARAGSRYKEQLMAYFGANNGDDRLDRPEYLGGGKQPVIISEVLNTSDTATAPQGNMSGHGLSVGSSASFKKTFTEHGHVIGMLSVIPKTCYFQGVDKRFTREDRFDYPFPEFANLGEQEVKNHELYQPPTDTALDTATFGYQQRYAEMKYKTSTVHGDFKDTLKFWTEAREFSTAPALNEDFVKCTPSERIFAVQGSDDSLYCHMYHSFKARRPLPYFSDPKL